jgi:hypothetical protein
MTSLARYMQYLFNLQHNTTRTGMQQRTRLTAYKESATAATHEMERLRHESAILHSGARPPSEQDRELQKVYVALVTPSMVGTASVCCSTSPTRRSRPVPTGLSTLSTMWRRRRRSPILSSSCWSFRCRPHLSLSTPRRSMPRWASMRARSHRRRMWGDKILSGLD